MHTAGAAVAGTGLELVMNPALERTAEEFRTGLDSVSWYGIYC